MLKLSRGVWVAIWLSAFIWIWAASLYASLTLAVLLAFCVTVAVFWRAVKLNGLISGNTALIALMAVFHFGVVVPVYLFGAPEPLITWHPPWMVYPELPYIILLCALGMLATQAGFEWGKRGRIYENRKSTAYKQEVSKALFQFWTLVTLVLLIIYFIMAYKHGMFASLRINFIHAQGAGELKWFLAIQELCILSGFIAIAFAPRKWVWWIGLAIILPLVPVFLLGGRGPMIVTVAALAVVFYMKEIRISRTAIIGGVVLVIILVPVMRHIRGGAYSFSSVAALDPFYEMGQQLRTVVYTHMALHQHIATWWLGSSYWDAFKRIIPNIGGINPRAISPTDWVTGIFRPGGAGLGYSIFAEAYLNFGVPGVVAIPALIGYVLARLKALAYQSPYGLAIYGVFLKSFFWLVRNDSYTAMRSMTWILILLGITILISKSIKPKRSGATISIQKDLPKSYSHAKRNMWP